MPTFIVRAYAFPNSALCSLWYIYGYGLWQIVRFARDANNAVRRSTSLSPYLNSSIVSGMDPSNRVLCCHCYFL